MIIVIIILLLFIIIKKGKYNIFINLYKNFKITLSISIFY